MNAKFGILIGTIGDDSHSIGTTLLAIAFKEAGFRVKNMGILNSLDDFFYSANEFDAIFISCMNGHADLYLKSFPEKFNLFKNSNNMPKLWYLGGNLSVQASEETVIKKYLGMGFDYVAPKPVSSEIIMRQLGKDLYDRNIKKKKKGWVVEDNFPDLDLEGIDDAPLNDMEFFRIRNEILESWHTGSSVRTANISENHADPEKNFHRLLRMKRVYPIVQPRTGVAHTSDEISILKFLRKKGLDMSSIQLDAASRKNLYAEAEEGVRKTDKGKGSFLNGYPVPVHGVSGIKEIMDAIDTPFQIRAGSPDHRFVYELALAGGASSLEGGFICYLYPYDKGTSPVDSLKFWKYVDKLAQYYLREYGIIINREYFGPLTCSLIEPSIPICIEIVQALLSAKAGVQSISVGLAEQGNRIQDIAAIRTLKKLTRNYLQDFGYGNVHVSTVFHQYMAAFPGDVDKARQLIFSSSVTAGLAGADRIMTKTPVESVHIPFKENNAEGLQLTRQGLKKSSDTQVDTEAVNSEQTILELEVQAIMNYIFRSGRGSVARGTLKAFQEGILDIPFSPNIYNRGRLLTARDSNGAIRFVNPEILPFDDQTKDFHLDKVHRRMSAQRVSKVSEMIESDLTRIWKNDYLSWPLDNHYLL